MAEPAPQPMRWSSRNGRLGAYFFLLLAFAEQRDVMRTKRSQPHHAPRRPGAGPLPSTEIRDAASSKPICRSRAQNLFAASCRSEPVPATIISNHCCRTRSSQVTWAQHLRTERTSVGNQRDQRENNNKLFHDTSPCLEALSGP